MHMHMIKMVRHQQTKKCNRVMEMHLWRRDIEISQMAGEIKFILYNSEYYPLVEGVTQFHYLGRILEEIDSYWPEVHQNISKVWSVW